MMISFDKFHDNRRALRKEQWRKHFLRHGKREMKFCDNLSILTRRNLRHLTLNEVMRQRVANGMESDTPGGQRHIKTVRSVQ
jgi:hypothetical protein